MKTRPADRTTHRRTTGAGRALAFAGTAVGAVALTAGAAGAHVTIGEQDQIAGSYTVLTVSVPHGCENAATTAIRIAMPEQIPTVTPTVNPNWDVEVRTEKLAEAVDVGHGQQVTERDSEVVYTAKTPLPSGLRDTMELSVRVPDSAAGETLYFPIIQECEGGAEAAWIERPEAGQDSDELENPAPFIVVRAGSGDGHGGAPGTTVVRTALETETASPASSTAPDESGSNALSIVAIVVGGLGVVLGGAALATRRR